MTNDTRASLITTRTAHEKAKQAVNSRDGTRGDPPSLDGGTDGADLGANCTMNLDIYHKDHKFILWLDILQAYNVIVDMKHNAL
jgi:hypothetical protein